MRTSCPTCRRGSGSGWASSATICATTSPTTARASPAAPDPPGRAPGAYTRPMRPELIALVVAAVALPGIVVALVAVHRKQLASRLEAAERLGLAYARDREGAAR